MKKCRDIAGVRYNQTHKLNIRERNCLRDKKRRLLLGAIVDMIRIESGKEKCNKADKNERTIIKRNGMI